MPRDHIEYSRPVGDQVAYTTCYMCACRCGIKVHLRDGTLRYIEGNRDHPVNRGVLCAKGSAGIMNVLSPARLRAPLKTIGPRGSGEFAEISWDEALTIATGYVLQPGLDLPPLMLTPDEIEAAVLGAQWVARHSDAELARAAQDLIAKIGAVVPERLRPFVFEPVTETPPARSLATDGLDMARVRAQIHAGRKIKLCSRDEQGRESDRIIWPVTVGYMETVRHLIAWCELRQDFRSFRTDRVIAAGFLDERYPERPSALRAK
jgi:hypothetical protein